MRTAIAVLGLVLASIAFNPTMAAAGPVATSSATKQVPTKQHNDDDDENRRCAYLGKLGAFTLTGPKGTAAYMLGRTKYIADLVPSGEEANWWLYRPTDNSDPDTIMWAFAKHPICGKYAVLRFTKGSWKTFEQTTAWGNELNGSGAAEAVFRTGASNEELMRELRAIKEKLNFIQPGEKPSLKELEQQILKKQ